MAATFKFLLIYKSGAQQEIIHRPIVGPVVDELGINFEGFLKGGKQTKFLYGFRDRPQTSNDTSININAYLDFSQLAAIRKLEE